MYEDDDELDDAELDDDYLDRMVSPHFVAFHQNLRQGSCNWLPGSRGAIQALQHWLCWRPSLPSPSQKVYEPRA